MHVFYAAHFEILIRVGQLSLESVSTMVLHTPYWAPMNCDGSVTHWLIMSVCKLISDKSTAWVGFET